MESVVIKTRREGYSKDQVRETLTVSQLIDVLSDFDGDLPVYLDFDDGYTYGGLDRQKIDFSEED